MAIVYNKYNNNKDHTWYDSSNVKYSVCYDTNADKKILKVVFNQGRTYLYKDVDVNDYLLFRNSESHGKSVNTFIVKKYKGVRLPDTTDEELDKLKEEFMKDSKVIENAFSNLVYHMEINGDTKEFRLYLNNKLIYEGIENKVSITRLLKCMNINYSFSEMKNHITSEEDFISQ